MVLRMLGVFRVLVAHSGLLWQLHALLSNIVSFGRENMPTPSWVIDCLAVSLVTFSKDKMNSVPCIYVGELTDLMK